MEMPYLFTPNLLVEVPDLPPDSIVSRTYYQDEFLKVILFGFAKNQELSEHTASVPAIIHILEGEANITLEKDEYSVQSGAWIHMPPNFKHSIYAKTTVRMLLIMMQKRE
jgi:quercetin dioxygenase-like cupin family protein